MNTVETCITSELAALSGKIGRLKGVSTKTAYSNVITHTEENHD